jgi:hypothetical protein
MQSDKRATPTQAGHLAADIAHHLRMHQATRNWPGQSNEGRLHYLVMRVVSRPVPAHWEPRRQ